MAFDYKKEYKEFYLPKSKPEIINVPPMNYIAVVGEGDPNDPEGAYQTAISVLYGIAYTIKMSKKTDHRMEGYFDFVVPPLEGFWRQGNGGKSDFRWISVMRLPEFVTEAEFRWAMSEAERKKGIDCSGAKYLTVDEGLCVQMMHIGSYDDEPQTVAKMDAFLAKHGYVADLTDTRLHHEIYISDPRKTAPEKRKTVIRHPIRIDC